MWKKNVWIPKIDVNCCVNNHVHFWGSSYQTITTEKDLIPKYFAISHIDTVIEKEFFEGDDILTYGVE